MISVLEMFVFLIGRCHCAGSQVLLLNCAFPNYHNFFTWVINRAVPKLLIPVVNSTLVFYAVITAVLTGNRNSEHLIIRAVWHHDSGSYCIELEICPFLLDAFSAPWLQIFWKHLNMKAKMRPQKYMVPDPMPGMDQNLWKWTIESLFQLYISDYFSATALSDHCIRKQLTGNHNDKEKKKCWN